MNGPISWSEWITKRAMMISVTGQHTEDRHFLDQVWIIMVNLAIHLKLSLLMDDCLYIFDMATISFMFLSVRGMMYYRRALELQCHLEFPDHTGLLLSWHILLEIWTVIFGFAFQYFRSFRIVITKYHAMQLLTRYSLCSFKGGFYSCAGSAGFKIHLCCILSDLWSSENLWWFSRSKSSQEYSKSHVTVCHLSMSFIRPNFPSKLKIVMESFLILIFFRYPSLRVAYIDEREETVNGESQKSYYSVLVKGGDKFDGCERVSASFIRNSGFILVLCMLFD